MNEIIDFIEQNKYGSLATCNGGKSDIRPFELAFYCDRGMFFYTSSDKDIYEQLNVNPYISFCATDQNLIMLRSPEVLLLATAKMTK